MGVMRLVALHMEDPLQARAIAKIEPHPLASFGFSCVLMLGTLLGGLIAFADSLTRPFPAVIAGGMLAFVIAWVPLTLSLHWISRLLGHRADYGSLQTQVALALWPLAILPAVGLVQFLSGWDSKILFCGAAAGVGVAALLFLRQGLMDNYGMKKPQANIALIGASLLLAGLLGFILAGLTSGAVLWVIASSILS